MSDPRECTNSYLVGEDSVYCLFDRCPCVLTQGGECDAFDDEYDD